MTVSENELGSSDSKGFFLSKSKNLGSFKSMWRIEHISHGHVSFDI